MRASPVRWSTPSRRCVEDDETILVQALGSKEALAELKAAGWGKVPYAEDGRPFGDGVFPDEVGRVQIVNEAWRRWGNRCCRRSCPRVERINGDRDLAARFPSS